MASNSRPIKLACLACRAAKIRCDGQTPCASCSIHEQECQYRASRRGGARRGPAAARTLLAKRRAKAHFLNNHTEDDSSVSINISPPSPPFNEIPGVYLTSTIRSYTCDQDLLNGYYVFIHPYFPLLPPPATPQYEDRCVTLLRSSADTSQLPYWPTSSLGLALAAILTLIPPPGATTTGDEASTIRHSYADLYARSALESLEDALEPSSSTDLSKGSRSCLHPNIPQGLEPVLALSLFSMYEHCQRGKISKMRVRANQALTTAMDLGLHAEAGQEVECVDARRRCWWTTVFLVYHSSIINESPPIITLLDLRITTPFPEFRGCREPWPLLANAQEALLRSRTIERQILDATNLPPSLRDEIHHLHTFILDLAAETDRFRCVTNYQGAEAYASRNLWAISSALVHTSMLTLHGVFGFKARLGGSLQTHSILSAHRIAGINALAPAAETECIRTCMHSALVVSRVFRRLTPPNTRYSDTAESCPPPQRQPWSPRSIPYMVCFEFQSAHVLATCVRRVRTALLSGSLREVYFLLDRASERTEVQDAERLMEELRSGIEALRDSIRADGVFKGVVAMAEEVEGVYKGVLGD